MILIISAIYNPEPGISGKVAESLALSLAKSGNIVNVIAPFPSRPHGYNFNLKIEKHEVFKNEINENLFFERLPSFTYSGGNLLFRISESISFGLVSFKYIRSNRCEIKKVYMNTWPLFGQFLTALACKVSKIPYAIHIQDIYPESFTNKLPKLLRGIFFYLLLPFDKYVLKNADSIIVISETMRNLIQKTRKVNEKNLHVVINWQNPEEFTNYKTTKPNRKFTFMYLGNIGPVAGIPFIMRSFAKAKIDAKLIIAGSGSAREDCISLAKLYLNSDIEFKEVPLGKAGEIQSNADVFLLPLISGAASSSIPSKLPAYMFSGKPVLASIDKNSETEKCIIEADCGWITRPGDEAEMVKLLRKIINEPQSSLAEKGSNAYQYAVKYFAKEINLKKLISAFDI